MTPLILNIKKQNFFQSSSKRPLDNDSTFATISAKKRKIGFGKPLRVFAKSKAGSSKLGLASSINYVRETLKKGPLGDVSLKTKPLLEGSLRSETLEFRQPRQLSKGNVKPSKGRVSFNDSVTTISSDNFDSRKDKESPQKSISAQAQDSGPFYSSLFSKAPKVPEIARVDVKPSKAEVFSKSSFTDLTIAPQIVANLAKLGCTVLTTVQHMGMPPIFDGKDVLIKSQTGSGKTLAYAVPIIHTLMKMTPKVERTHGLYALIIVPTRELAIQTYQWMEKLCKSCVWVVPGYLIGGEKKKSEKNRLRKGINVLVATPGRLTDHINNTNCLSLVRIKYLVLDEADRMLEMGYEQSIKGILYALNEVQGRECRRQTILLSATLTGAVEKLAGMSLRNPEIIDITSTDGDEMKLTDQALVTPKNLSHFFLMVPPKLRLVVLAAFILLKCKFTEEKKMLIFMTTQDMVDYHTSLFSTILSRIGKKRNPNVSDLEREADSVLTRGRFRGSKKKNKISNLQDDVDDIDETLEDDIHFFKLHGNMSQPERTAVFKTFCEASSGVMFSTDVASRGLDLPKVNWIVQYNAACGASEYVHRVGRTARVDAKGSAVVFINPTESTFISKLEGQGIKFNDIKLEEILKILTHKSLYHKDVKIIPRNMEDAATFLQNECEDLIAEDPDMHSMALQGYVSFVRSYAAIPKDLREYFCFKLLHLGHYAKSFALRETPAVLGNKGMQSKKRDFRPKSEKEQEYVVRRDKPLPQPSSELFVKRNSVSEFGSGLDGIDEEREKKLRKKKSLKNKMSANRTASRTNFSKRRY